ncbi:hypothetical protein [Streptomyces nojiriensis]|uniref:hypothetical protein n=1 Tax=Streptomyces nojiriensis TaxID=66374 RepID=UPI0036767A18
MHDAKDDDRGDRGDRLRRGGRTAHRLRERGAEAGINSGFEQQTLPWSKSGTAELTAAEQKVGYLVNVVPGTITGPDGKLQQAPCVIKVDGKKVAESDGVTTVKGCSYTIK